ncbi:unnamed protein product [Danaus chrysippus]|uniref:(African queen) hypothetical protein n=1 Tax=Danaus chrysippus TaxID=151541 RepID=A0A8J2WB19_9NEOP|nr:unnamed protein product [Danaus chrysippus]
MIKIVCWSLLLLAGSYGLPLDSEGDTSMYFSKIDPVLFESYVAGPVPYIVSITIGRPAKLYLCAASIITTRHFITLATCVFYPKEISRYLRGTVGSNLVNSGGTHYSFDRVIIHDEFDIDTGKNDISILVTSSVVKLSKTVQPVALNFDYIPPKVAAVVNGWGLTNFSVIDTQPPLMELQVNTVDGNKCGAEIDVLAKKLKVIAPPLFPELEICAFHNATSGVCYGDAGSPLVLKENRQLIGMVAWFIDCAKGVPDVYTRVRLPLDSVGDTSVYFSKIDPVLIESYVAGPVPYMVALTIGEAPRTFICGASIITTRHFLTVAVCVYTTTQSNRFLRGTVGSNRVNSRGTHYSFDRVIIHDKFDIDTGKNDISILVTSSVVKLSKTVQPVALNFDYIPPKVAAIVNGWGLFNLTTFVAPIMLRELQVNTVDSNECAAEIADLAKKVHFDAHHGDAGSPLVLKENRQLIGMVAWSVPCALGVPDVYTRVSAFKSWIQKNTVL